MPISIKPLVGYDGVNQDPSDLDTTTAAEACESIDYRNEGGLNEAEVRKFKLLSGMIRDDVHFQAILQTEHDAEKREAVYKQLKPFLKFRPRAYAKYRWA